MSDNFDNIFIEDIRLIADDLSDFFDEYIIKIITHLI
jgi:hypothetical protein